MTDNTRISKEPAEFDDYMNLTDNLQLSHYGTPPVPRYTLFGWTPEESAAWTAFRTESNLIFSEYSDPDKKGKGVIARMNKKIAEVRKYDNDKVVGHHLLDKVALGGTVDDCLTFNVVRGTSLQANPIHHADNPIVFTPVLKFKSYELGQHVISVVCSGTNSKKLPEGMVFAKVYRYIGATPPTGLKQYEMIGNAKYGIYRSNFADIVPGEDEVLVAYYYGRYESKNGQLGNPGAVIKAPIMLAEV